MAAPASKMPDKPVLRSIITPAIKLIIIKSSVMPPPSQSATHTIDMISRKISTKKPIPKKRIMVNPFIFLNFEP